MSVEAAAAAFKIVKDTPEDHPEREKRIADMDRELRTLEGSDQRQLFVAAIGGAPTEADGCDCGAC